MPLSPASKNDDEGAQKGENTDDMSGSGSGGEAVDEPGGSETEAKAGNGHVAIHVDDDGRDGELDKKEEDGGVEEEEDEDDEDEEPSLKYERIEGAIPDLLKKDSASSLAIVNRTMALGTHGGIVHILDLTGKRLKSYKPHMASVVDISIDSTGDFVATASIDGHILIHSITTTESYGSDMKRPMRTIAMEPNFGKRNTRAYACGGMSGNLVLRERGWLGHKETLLNAGEGPIWQVRWRGKFIAWADDNGVKIYDTNSQTRFATIDRPPDSPRADLFKCTLYWQDDTTLLIGWANTIKVARIRARHRTSTTTNPAVAKAHPYHVEIVAFFKLDCMLSGLAAHPLPNQGNNNLHNDINSHDNNLHPNNKESSSTPDLNSPARQPSPTRTNASSIPSGYKSPIKEPSGGHSRFASATSILSYASSSKLGGTKETTASSTPSITAFLIVAYTPPETFQDEMTDDRAKQARKAAERPELRIISRAGEELTADALGVTNYQAWGCNDYTLVEVDSVSAPASASGAASSAPPGGEGIGDAPAGKCYVVLTPRDLVLVKPRDRRDHVTWLVERERYEEALEEAEVLEFETAAAAAAVVGVGSTSGLMNGNGLLDEKKLQDDAATSPALLEKVGKNNGVGETGDPLSSAEIGRMYIEYLIDRGNLDKAASLFPKVCGKNVKRWEDWIFSFAEQRQLQAVIPYIPIDSPTLDRVVYDMILAHFLAHDHQMLLQTIKEWPKDLYDITAVIFAVRADLDKASTYSFSTKLASASSRSTTVLMECLAELYFINRQPGKALPYYLRLRRPNVFDLIRENNLFTDVSDQVLLLVEFDNELMMKKKEEGKAVDESKSEAITLLVDNIHSIPITKVVQQLLKKPHYLFLYLDALVSQDAHLVSDFADLLVKLYAEYATQRLIDFLRASNYYNLEQAFEVCKERDLVPEMVFLLGKMGNNKQALTLIIERLGDVHRAIDFAKEQNDDDLWEDLLRYSETRPMFIRGLLENVGVEISPIRLIRRIKNGLEIPGLKDALIKILQDFHLQISLLEGCQTILNGDSLELSRKLQKAQTSGFFLSAKTQCQLCSRLIQDAPNSLIVLYLCRHVVHASCLNGSDQLPSPPDITSREVGLLSAGREINGRIAYESIIRARLGRSCPVCGGRSDRDDERNERTT